MWCIFRWTYSDPSWARIAALVPVVVSCAEAGDQVANRILQDAVQELASSVKAVVQRLGLCGKGVELILLVALLCICTFEIAIVTCYNHLHYAVNMNRSYGIPFLLISSLDSIFRHYRKEPGSGSQLAPNMS